MPHDVSKTTAERNFLHFMRAEIKRRPWHYIGCAVAGGSATVLLTETLRWLLGKGFFV